MKQDICSAGLKESLVSLYQLGVPASQTTEMSSEPLWGHTNRVHSLGEHSVTVIYCYNNASKKTAPKLHALKQPFITFHESTVSWAS